ncbi:hypothetical protein [Pseudodesulfovibrio indicus]|uniref:Conjugal transfer protein TrbJ n=1 Tax=Pseudodesulfovibrio indicus TaxID=1716143 RepID=A0A126QQL7_9BACT|nr:hypothetical protein [Pseudodesulfovibrio indicus]AMK12036.1 hypothetical protein AWY79_13435 [Pseudodesulfovibrio indicus]TDT88635.1 hypothetical protein EDC59_10536 [Pseudodesulfovibrio indicus]
MKRTLRLTIFSLALLNTSVAFASGMAVSDALSHIYESKQLENIVQQLETGLKQLELVQQYTDTIQTTYDKAHTNYKRAKGVYDDLMAVKEFYESTKNTWMGRYEQYKGLYDSIANPDLEDFQDLLDGAFVDPRNIDPMEWKKLIDRQFDMRQLALKDLLDKTEKTTQDMGGRIEKAQNLARDIDETGSEKDAMDLNNRLLFEILSVLQEMMAMDSRYQQTMASLEYEGVTEGSIKARQEKLKELESNYEKFRYEVQVINSYGVDVNSDSALDAMDKVINQGL